MSDEAAIVAVEFVAEIRQVKTMADHTVNVTLNLPEYCKGQAAWFMQHQGDMVISTSLLQSVTDDKEQHKPQTNKRAARNPIDVVGG